MSWPTLGIVMSRRQASEAFVMRLMSASIAATAAITAVRAQSDPAIPSWHCELVKARGHSPPSLSRFRFYRPRFRPNRFCPQWQRAATAAPDVERGPVMYAASQIAETLPSDQFRRDLVTDIKNLRSFAICLSGSISAADDLVEATLLRAWSKSDRFRVTNRQICFMTILRDILYSSFRKLAVDVDVQSGSCVYTDFPVVYGAPEGHFDPQEIRQSLAKLAAYQLEALIIVDASGHTYEEAAVICQIDVKTVKKRLSRARSNLIELLSL